MRSINLAVVLLSLAVPVLALEVPLSVEEPIGAERKLEVVSGGIPLPQGKYKDAAAFSLFDGATEVPVQVSPIVKYPDGSLHWALVSFPVSLKAKEKKAFALKDAPGKAAPQNPVIVKEDGDLVEVSNGLVAFAVSKSNFNGFEWIKAGGKEVFKAAKAGFVVDGKGGPGKATHFDFVYRGPVRTTLYVKGTYGAEKTPTFAVAITLNANESAIHLDHNLRNGGIGVKKITVNSPEMHLGLAGDLKAAGGGKASTDGGKRKVQPAYGWKEFSGASDVLVFLRHGGPIGGKDLEMTYEAAVAGGELVVDMSTVKGNPYGIPEGGHKITEIDLVFGKSKSPEALAEPLHALAPCAWYSEHDGMGVGRGFGSLADETATYKAAGWSKFDDPKKMQSVAPDPNRYAAWIDVHDTSECDQIEGLVIGYLRTGQRGFLDQASAWQRYWRTRYMYRTDDFTFGKEGRRGSMEKFGIERTCAGGCHTFGVGIFGYALLTGNVDALEAAFDLAEQCNATGGSYSKSAIGKPLGYWGSRGYVRNFQAVARAYDVARNKDWEERVVYFVNAYLKAEDRDPRGFINHGYVSGHLKEYLDKMGDKAPAAAELMTKDGVTVEGGKFKSDKYGTYPIKEFGTWPEAMGAQSCLMAYEALSQSGDDAAAKLAAEDAMDLAIVAGEIGQYWAFDKTQKAVYYYMFFDYPIPGFAPLWKGGKWDAGPVQKGSDSWYTKWWPNVMAAGYKLTGEKTMRETMVEMLWWGLSRNFTAPPRVPQGEAPPYASIAQSTKDDWMTTTALAFGVGARPKKDETPPAAIADLKASAGGGKVELSWSAPKDEGGGKVAMYQVKWSEMPMDDYPVDGDLFRKNYKDGQVTVTYWNMANNVLGEPSPQPAGKAEKMVLDVPAGKKIWVAVRAFDDSHNRSKMSNVVEVEAK